MSATTVVVPAAGEGGLPLAGKSLGVLVAHEVPSVGGEVGRDEEGLIRLHARERVAGDVPHRVATGLAGDESHVAQDAHHVGGVRQLHEVHLEVLTRRDVSLLEGGVFGDELAEGVHLVGGHGAAGDLDAHHLHVGLALTVHAADEAVHDELVLGWPLAVQSNGWTRSRSHRLLPGCRGCTPLE